jgi:hypothetical protein
MEGTAAGAKTSVVQPGLPVDAEAMWRLGAADAPDKFTVGLRTWEYRRGFTVASFSWWLDQDAGSPFAGRLTLPVATS